MSDAPEEVPPKETLPKRRPTPAQEARLAAGYVGKEGLERLSKKCGIAPSTLAQHFTGYSNPGNYRKAERLAAALHCSMEVLRMCRPGEGNGKPRKTGAAIAAEKRKKKTAAAKKAAAKKKADEGG